ncbi:MAG: 4-hydroxy-3-methylbut-2-enyl diphosphate reductase [Planctomycetaceae bacterium]
MQIIRAREMGMCFGVRDALALAHGIDSPHDIAIHGELVHNELVLVELAERGFRTTPETDRDGLPETSEILVTAHGISDRERGRLEAAGKRLIDTTCPLVRRAHHAAHTLAADNFHVLVIGRPGHVEVRGIVEDLPSHDVLASVDDVRTWDRSQLGIVCQTTTPPRLAAAIHEAVRERNPHAEIRFVDTVCHPTRDRQHAVEELCERVDLVVVVGGSNSNNTRQLVESCRERGTRAVQVQSAEQLDPKWFSGCRTVGLTAGTSTLDETVDQVEAALIELNDARRRESSCFQRIENVSSLVTRHS